jgi:hypothetical protein
MLELKPLHRDALDRAMRKAEHYRLLNEPRMAESICLDLLQADPDNQHALTTLILSLTDQFGDDGFCVSNTSVQDLVPRLTDPYERLYYSGIICERRGQATLNQRVPGYVAFDWFKAALEFYEQAEAKSPEGNDDAIVRYNTCVRIIQNNASIEPQVDDTDFEHLE